MGGLVDSTHLASKLSPSHSLSTGFDELGFMQIKHWHTVFMRIDLLAQVCAGGAGAKHLLGRVECGIVGSCAVVCW